MSKIFIIEDEKKLQEELEVFLNNNHYETAILSEFTFPVEKMMASDADLFLLDLSLPNQEGESIMREFRKVDTRPVIIVTSRNTELDELISMNYGADDFVTKPYHPQILLAHIEAILKRSKTISSKVFYEGIYLNLSKGTIEKGTEEIELSKNELKMFDYLLRKRGVIVSREELMEYLWDSEMFVDENTLNVNMNRLRKKLEECGLENRIETRRGQGYILK